MRKGPSIHIYKQAWLKKARNQERKKKSEKESTEQKGGSEDMGI